MKKRYAPMLLVHNNEGDEVFFHYHDDVRARQYEEPKVVWVVMNQDYFIGTWQFAKTIEGYAGYYESEEEARKYLKN